jgi:hypothetical protein
MMYRDIVKKLAGQVGVRFADLAEALGMSGQARLSARLAESWNPGMRDAQALLAELGYKIVFVPERTACREGWYEPEFPDRPEPRAGRG